MERYIRNLGSGGIWRLMAAFVLFAAALPGVASALTIDNFLDENKAEANGAGVTAYALSVTSNAIGGSRALKAQVSQGLLVRLATTLGPGNQGILDHSQTNTSTGSTQVTWDGNLDPADLDFDGLGGVNLIEDGGTAIVLTRFSYDAPGGKPVEIRVTLYDARDSSGQTFTRASWSTSEFVDDKTVTLPFVDFKPGDPNKPARLDKIGAITLEILGEFGGIDVNFDLIGTNGKCPQIPPKGGKILDDCGVCNGGNRDKDSCGVCFGNNASKDSCGVCNGNNAAKDQCGVCFGNNRDIDQCGVCFGNNRDLDDCGVCGGGNSSKDQCGICGGDDTTCLDCKGLPNGGAVLDLCGICGGDGKSCLDCSGVAFGSHKPDRCGVCNGDGSSCLGCTATSLASTLEKLRGKSFEQQLHNLTFLDKVVNTAPHLVKGIRSKVQKAYGRLLTQIKALPAEIQSCENSALCVESVVNAKVIETYQGSSHDLYRLAIKIFTSIRDLKGSGVCEGDLKQCERRVRARKRELKYLRSFARRLFNENVQLSKEIPITTSVCS